MYTGPFEYDLKVIAIEAHTLGHAPIITAMQI